MSTLEINVMADKLQECLFQFLRIQTLKAEQIEALEALLVGCDVLAFLPTGFGKSLIYQVFCQAKLISNPKANVLVISPLNSIVDEQVNELAELGFPFIHLKENNADCMKAISKGKFRFIFCCAERCLTEEFKHVLKSEDRGPDI